MVSLRVLAVVILMVKGLDCAPTVDCTINSNYRLRCKVLGFDKNLEDYEFHWYQKYNKTGSLIGPKNLPAPTVKGKHQEFQMWIQKFDNLTYIYAELIDSKDPRIHFPTESYQINTKRNSYTVRDKITYSESKPVNFACKNDAHSQVGWIEPTGKKITIHRTANHSLQFGKIHSGSLFCCLRYEINDWTLTRYIDDITELIYEEPSNQGVTSRTQEPNDHQTTPTQEPNDHQTTPTQEPNDHQTTPTQEPNDHQTTSTKKPDDHQTTSTKKPDDHQTTSTKKPDDHQTTPTQEPAFTENPLNTNEPKPSDNVTEPQNTDHLNGSLSTSDNTIYYVIVAAVVGIILVTLLIYVMVKKYTRKASDHKTRQLNDTSTAVSPWTSGNIWMDSPARTDVVYAEPIRPGNAPAPAVTENPHYAEIIRERATD
ncbi:hypothetical protein PYW08_010888 [Mythimna loreyi]|uniref:Uncharacterized protein n=1 Tax=Mythimna loreyi TaxID=667449 RepID=A0ACC2Q3N7_9NEOP|nr:hypothetical protein PYW08_010888 [Mythimna loreyi]